MPRRSVLAPLLAGGTSRDRIAAGIGAFLGIALTGLVSGLVLSRFGVSPLLVAPMGASAVLLFAVPASPLAQPWSIFGGNTLSALVGVMAARWISEPMTAAGVAVGGAILVMSMLRCLHPPGGAAALTAVIGGPAVTGAGFLFPLAPVALNSLLLLGVGWMVHRLSGHRYPHRPPPVAPGLLQRADIDRALADAHETFDIDPADLDALLQRAEQHALARRTGFPARSG